MFAARTKAKSASTSVPPGRKTRSASEKKTRSSVEVDRTFDAQHMGASVALKWQRGGASVLEAQTVPDRVECRTLAGDQDVLPRSVQPNDVSGQKPLSQIDVLRSSAAACITPTVEVMTRAEFGNHDGLRVPNQKRSSGPRD